MYPTFMSNTTNMSNTASHNRCGDIYEIKSLGNDTDMAVFSVLIFICVNLIIASCYSIYRENYAIDPDYLKSTRTLLVATTMLQLVCFVGYWLGIFAMYKISAAVWYTLITLALVLMALKFGESYVLLVSDNYSLQQHNKIPTKYVVILFSIWFISACINTTGTIFGFVYLCDNKNVYNSSRAICYTIYDISCLILLGVLLYILKSITRRFSHILKKRVEYKQDRKQSKLRKRLVRSKPQTKPKKCQKKKPKEKTKTSTINEEQKYDGNSLNTYSILPSQTYTQKTTSQTALSIATATGSISILTQRGTIMLSEVQRMRILIFGLYVLFCIFFVNGLLHGYDALTRIHGVEIVGFLNKFIDTQPHDHVVGVWVIAGVFFSQWTVINVFVMSFSWIPGSQMLPEWYN